MDIPGQAGGASLKPVAGASPDPQDLRDQKARLWQHSLHEDNIFMQRGNFFLVAESMFVVAYAALMSAPASTSALTAARIISGFGFAFALVWAYANHRQVRYIRVIARRSFESFPELEATRGGEPRRQPSSTAMIAYVTPLLGCTMWIILGFVA